MDTKSDITSIIETLEQEYWALSLRDLASRRLTLLSLYFRRTFPTAHIAYLTKGWEDAHYYVREVVDQDDNLLYDDLDDERPGDIDLINTLVIDLGPFPEEDFGSSYNDRSQTLAAEVEGDVVCIHVPELHTKASPQKAS